MQKAVLVLSAFLFAASACVNPPNYPDEPEISFISMTPGSLDEGEQITIKFGFQDGNGDLGNDDGNIDGFLIDSRAPGFPEGFIIPFIEQIGNIDDISGEISFVPSAPPCLNGLASDTVTYSLYIVDRAGNQSNTIELPELIITCD